MADLAHEGDRVLAAGDEDRGEGVAQLVGGETFGQGDEAATHQQLVGALEGRREDATSQVLGIAAGAGFTREDEILGAGGVRCCLVRGEEVAQERQHLDLAQPRIGL